jgi:hypothetical protein
MNKMGGPSLEPSFGLLWSLYASGRFSLGIDVEKTRLESVWRAKYLRMAVPKQDGKKLS